MVFFHQFPWLDGYTRPVGIITVVCVFQIVCLMKRSIGPFFSKMK